MKGKKEHFNEFLSSRFGVRIIKFNQRCKLLLSEIMTVKFLFALSFK